MGISSYGYEDGTTWEWSCYECDAVIDLDHYNDIRAHVDEHIEERQKPPSIPAKCHYCQNYIDSAESHDLGKHPVGEPVATQYPKKNKVRNIIVVNYLRVSDDEVEYTSAFIQEDGNVVISAAWFDSLMTDGKWKKQK